MVDTDAQVESSACKFLIRRWACAAVGHRWILAACILIHPYISHSLTRGDRDYSGTSMPSTEIRLPCSIGVNPHALEISREVLSVYLAHIQFLCLCQSSPLLSLDPP